MGGRGGVGGGGGGVKGPCCRRDTIQPRSFDQVGHQVKDGGAEDDPGGASDGPTHLFDSGVIHSLTAKHRISSFKLDVVTQR